MWVLLPGVPPCRQVRVIEPLPPFPVGARWGSGVQILATDSPDFEYGAGQRRWGCLISRTVLSDPGALSRMGRGGENSPVKQECPPNVHQENDVRVKCRAIRDGKSWIRCPSPSTDGRNMVIGSRRHTPVAALHSVPRAHQKIETGCLLLQSVTGENQSFSMRHSSG